MEGQPKSFAEKTPTSESNEGVEVLIDSAESIEQALELHAQIKEINEAGDVFGPEAMAENAKAEQVASEFTKVLKRLSDPVRLKYGFPLRSPLDEKLESSVTPFPAKPSPEYVERLGYTPGPSPDGARVDQRQAA